MGVEKLLTDSALPTWQITPKTLIWHVRLSELAQP